MLTEFFKNYRRYIVHYSLYGNNIVYYMLSLIYFIGAKLLCVEPLFFMLKVIDLVEIYVFVVYTYFMCPEIIKYSVVSCMMNV
jgi:hypothetical protein